MLPKPLVLIYIATKWTATCSTTIDEAISLNNNISIQKIVKQGRSLISEDIAIHILNLMLIIKHCFKSFLNNLLNLFKILNLWVHVFYLSHFLFLVTETINLTKVPLVCGYKACRQVFLHITVWRLRINSLSYTLLEEGLKMVLLLVTWNRCINFHNYQCIYYNGPFKNTPVQSTMQLMYIIYTSKLFSFDSKPKEDIYLLVPL